MTLLVRRGDIDDGLRYAARVLDELPIDQHNALLYEVGRQVMQMVPNTEQRRAEYGDLHERLRTPPTNRDTW